MLVSGEVGGDEHAIKDNRAHGKITDTNEDKKKKNDVDGQRKDGHSRPSSFSSVSCQKL